MNITQDKTDLTDKTPLLVAAESVFASAAASYLAAIEDQRYDIEQAVAVKAHLGDGYWKPVHTARLRYLAAMAVMEAVNED